MKKLATVARKWLGWLPSVVRRGRPVLLTLLLALGGLRVQGQSTSFFADDAAAQRVAPVSPLTLRAARPLTLNVAGLRAALASAPLERVTGAAPLRLVLPLPNGTNATFLVREAPVMAPALAAQFPAIKTYVGVGVADPTASLRLDLTPQGLHAQVLSTKTGNFYLDPTAHAATTPSQYLSYWKRDVLGQAFTCDIKSPLTARTAQSDSLSPTATGTSLRTYRLAVATTGEYTADQGGTVALGLAAVVTAVNRVVGVYEKEQAVRLELVAQEAALIYTDSLTDPYDNTGPGGLMLTQNQTTIDSVIGDANYDIGHVFFRGSGGLAGIGVVCKSGHKAEGRNGSPRGGRPSYTSDVADHEMGHQFGATHIFNADCGGNRTAMTAYEPGGGTTIMGYATVCGLDNELQNHPDEYFNVANYEQIQAYIARTSCALTQATGNTPPTALLPTVGGGKVLPISTPFKLTAGGYDADGDTLTYCWEEADLGNAGSPTDKQVTNDNVPLFRSFLPSPSPTRYFPRLSDLLANTTTLGERLPTVTRALTFRLTLRDQHNGSQGVVGGLSYSPTLALTTTASAGPFVVTAPNPGVSLLGSSSQAVSWNVAGTDANGVNCASVNIRLSVDGGLTYPTLLLAGTPNTGTASVTLPSVATTTARVMVEAADNYFFAISNANFTITTSTVCAAPTSLSVSNVTATTATVSFTPSSSAATYLVSTLPATTTQTVTSSPVQLSGLSTGTTYAVSLVSNCAGGSTSDAATVNFSTNPPLASGAPLAAGQVSIAPNPAHSSFTLGLPVLTGQRAVQATLLNVLGQVVAQQTILLTATGATAEFDVRGLRQGVYMLRLAAGDQNLTRRIAVE